MENKTRTTVRLPLGVRNEMLQKIIEMGYGFRGKSKWITEAIESLLSLQDFEEYVVIADQMTLLTETEALYIPIGVKDSLSRSIVKVRKRYPELEGVQSCIIRSSIIQRLLRT